MPHTAPIPVTLVTGYLGAGKTTLLNHILTNDEGVHAAVIVNDIGEVNVDANLIQQGGVVDMTDSSLVALSNGCICCSLAGDLTKQLAELVASRQFDHIFIEASGICEPIPIAYNIDSFNEMSPDSDPLRLDNIIAVVDAKRMFDEFAGGKALLADDLDEDDIETLLVQQLEFCTTVILNKADLVSREQLDELRAIVRSLQKDAVIIEATNAEVPMAELIDTGRFDFNEAYNSAAWIDAMDHPEEHENPEVLEYGIQTFVYRRHQPFSREGFNEEVLNSWPRNVIRCKGSLWFSDDPDMSYLFEQSGFQFGAGQNGRFVASADEETRKQILDENPQVAESWDPVWGDRITELVFIGRNMDRARVEAKLDAALDPSFDPSDLD